MEFTNWQEWVFVIGYVSFLLTITWLVIGPGRRS